MEVVRRTALWDWEGRPAQILGRWLLALVVATAIGWGAMLWMSGAVPGKWVGLDIALQCWSMCALALFAARGRLGLSGWGAAGVCAAMLALLDPLANALHPFMMSHGLYPSFWGRGNDPQQSPQYARLLAWSVALALAWLRCARDKSWRTRSGSFIGLLGASSILATSLIFHVAMQRLATNDQVERFGLAKAMMQDTSSEAFVAFCKATRSRCAVGTDGFEDLIASDDFPKIAIEQARASWAAVGASGSGSWAQWRQPVRADTFNRLPSMMAAAGVSNSGQARFWADFEALPRTLASLEALYAWLALWAHGTWIGGSIWLGWRHERRGARRG